MKNKLHCLLWSVLFVCLSCTDLYAAQEKRVVLNSNGNKLVGIISRPDENNMQPLVILLHGLGGSKDSQLIRNLSDTLVYNGVATIRFDFDGHGESDGAQTDMTVLTEVDDAETFIEYAEGLDWVKSITLVGHSQGGLVAGLVAGKLGAARIPYLVQLAPAAIIADVWKSGKVAGQQIFDPSNPPAEYVFLNSFHLSPKYLEDSKKIKVWQAAEKYNGKVLLFQGDGDVLVPADYARKYQQAYKNADVRILSGEDHLFTHNQTQVITDIVRFVLKNNQ